jgi:hypothetical protein
MKPTPCSTHGKYQNAYGTLFRKPEGKRPLGRLRRIWEYDIKMDLRETGSEDVEWVVLVRDRIDFHELENEPSGSIKTEKFLTRRAP